ncbi:MAG: hypothetical protein HY788_13655 [Deltaproteobacteria bacterium]|nr:hypothetical protein [Deltaproteobacteria bacterium]
MDIHRTLCFPDGLKTCFRCCPPIRPVDYDHLLYRSFVERELREHTSALKERPPGVKPITGYSCWGLGYLDPDYRLVGCLLHPARNNGTDLRHLIDYGSKCRTATCREAVHFEALAGRRQSFWHGLCLDLDSFEYSSPRSNPLFHVLLWGPQLLTFIAEKELPEIARDPLIFERYPFLRLPRPGARRYLVERIERKFGLETISSPRFVERFEDYRKTLARFHADPATVPPDAPFTHRLGLDVSFSDFVRLELNYRRITQQRALELRDLIDSDMLKWFS